MKLAEFLLTELEREGPRTRRALEQVPVDRDDWAPHPKSMTLARLAGLVAIMPSWVPLIIEQPELDITPPPGGPPPSPPTAALVKLLDDHLVKARESLARADDEFLLSTDWQLRAGGAVVMKERRHVVLADTLNHWAHHRGQLTVYLRLCERPVPSIYGPSADDQRFL